MDCRSSKALDGLSTTDSFIGACWIEEVDPALGFLGAMSPTLRAGAAGTASGRATASETAAKRNAAWRVNMSEKDVDWTCEGRCVLLRRWFLAARLN